MNSTLVNQRNIRWILILGILFLALAAWQTVAAQEITRFIIERQGDRLSRVTR